MRVRLVGSLESIVITTWTEAPLASAGFESAVSPSSTRLRVLIAENIGASASLRALLRELGEHSLERIGDDELVARIVDLLQRGRLRVEVELREPMLSTPPEPTELRAPVELGPMPEAKDHWVEIMLVGEDDQGIGGVRCEVTLPDGRTLTLKADRAGLIRVDGISDPGECTVRFPGLDHWAWEPA